MAEKDYFSFENALDKLSLEEEDLKRLISAGEIRAFRDGSKMRLRAEDVARVAKDLGIGEAVGEDDAGEVLEVEEVLFSESADDEGMVTTQLSEEDTLLDDDLEVVEMDDEEFEPAVAAAAAAAPRGGGGRARAAAPEQSDSGMTVVAILAFVVMVYGLSFVFGMSGARSNGMTEPVVNMFGGGEG